MHSTDPLLSPIQRSVRPALRIALPNKGRLAQESCDLFSDAGLEVRAASDRSLTASLGGEFEAIFVRAQDIPEFVADGAADAGVTGLDLIRESERPLKECLDLGFGSCRLSVAVREDAAAQSARDLDTGVRIATTFPRLTTRHFAAMDRSVQIVPVSGAAEIAPHLGIADGIVDLVATGSTLRTNGLRELETVLTSTAQLVVARMPPRSSPAAAEALHELAAALESVVAARGQRYLMANVPRARLEEVRGIVPGLNGPTVVDVLDANHHVAVHAVVPAATVYRTVAQLKAIGAEGILVTRIERLTH